jgi:hypothetical protein
MQTLAAQAHRKTFQGIRNREELDMSMAMSVARDEWPDGKENLSGPYVIAISGFFSPGQTGRRLLAKDLTAATMIMSTMVAGAEGQKTKREQKNGEIELHSLELLKMFERFRIIKLNFYLIQIRQISPLRNFRLLSRLEAEPPHYGLEVCASYQK